MFDCMEIDFEIVRTFCKLNNNLHCDRNRSIVLTYASPKSENRPAIPFPMLSNISRNFCISSEGIIWLSLSIIYLFQVVSSVTISSIKDWTLEGGSSETHSSLLIFSYWHFNKTSHSTGKLRTKLFLFWISAWDSTSSFPKVSLFFKLSIS